MTETILITGGTGKIGTILVNHFSKKQFKVVFLGLHQYEIDKVVNKQQTNLYGLAIDLIHKDAISKILDFLKLNMLNTTSLINCARNIGFLKVEKNGITNRSNFIGELTLDVIVPYELSMALANQQNSKLKNIINISSIYGIVPPNPNLYDNPKTESPIQYGIAKSAQIHLTKELSIRLAPQEIRVNTVSYGGIEGRVNSKFKKRYAQLCPTKKMLREDEIIGAIDFLVSNFSSGTTGHNLVVDGGWTVW